MDTFTSRFIITTKRPSEIESTLDTVIEEVLIEQFSVWSIVSRGMQKFVVSTLKHFYWGKISVNVCFYIFITLYWQLFMKTPFYRPYKLFKKSLHGMYNIYLNLSRYIKLLYPGGNTYITYMTSNILDP